MTEQTKPAWTPGPWKHSDYESQDPNGGGPYVMVGNEESAVAMVLRSLDDARLIAAAPQLYEALGALHSAAYRITALISETDVHEPIYAELQRTLAAARAALAAATGETK